MGKKKYPMTEAGRDGLTEELASYKIVKRNEITERIKKARTFCDFSEDFEFADAIKEQESIEERIKMLEHMLSNVEIIEHDGEQKNKIALGHSVTIIEIPNGQEETYTIVGKAEADLAVDKISNESPMAKSLLGHKVNDKIKIQTPGGQIEIKVLEIE